MSTPGMGARMMHGIPENAVREHCQDTFTAYQPIMAEVFAELSAATAKFPPMRSGHEGWAILLEEVDELGASMDVMWEHVKADTYDNAMAEARQVAAMALRFLHDMKVLRDGALPVEAPHARQDAAGSPPTVEVEAGPDEFTVTT